MNFWNKFKKSTRLDSGEIVEGRPILCLAPMADVTDSAFRYIIAKYSKRSSDPSSSLSTDIFLLENSSCSPQSGSQGSLRRISKDRNPFVTWTEFVSADGLIKAPEEGKKKLLKDLEYSEIERPIVAQLFTSNPEVMEEAAKLVLDLGFDGLDINMGCPDKSIEKQGAGAALIKNPKLAREIINAAKRGVQNKIPVSVKTRLGYNKDELETWLLEILEENPAVVTIHARTRKEMSKVPARWERIKRAVEIRNEFRNKNNYSDTLIFGNGDVQNVEDAIRLTEETGCDGVMLGRAIFGNPWLFSSTKPNLREKLKVLIEHTKLFEEKLGGIKSFALMKKHFKSYIGVFDGSKKLKDSLMDTKDSSEVEKVVNDFLLSYNE